MYTFLQEIIWLRSLGRHPSRLLRCSFKNGELTRAFVKFKQSGDVTATITIVRRTPHCEHSLVEVPFVALHDQLMCATNQRQPVRLAERLHHVLTKEETRAPRTAAPSLLRIFGVGPEEITHRPVMGHFLFAVEVADLVEGHNAGGEAAMDAEYFVVDDGGETEVVEYLCAVAPHRYTSVLANTLIIEPINLQTEYYIKFESMHAQLSKYHKIS